VHVDLDEVVVGEVLGEREAGLLGVLDGVEPVVEGVQGVKFLDQEARLVRSEGILSDGHFVRLEERLDSVFKKLSLEQGLTLVEKQFIHRGVLFLTHLVECLFDQVGLSNIISGACQNVGNEVGLVVLGDHVLVERSQVVRGCLRVHSQLVFDLG